MVPAVGGSDVGDIIAHIRSYDGANELPEDSRQSLLQAAKELQYNLETPKETCLRYRYSVRVRFSYPCHLYNKTIR